MDISPQKIALLEQQIVFASGEVNRMFTLVNSGYKMNPSEKVGLDKYMKLVEQGEQIVKEYRLKNGRS